MENFDVLAFGFGVSIGVNLTIAIALFLNRGKNEGSKSSTIQGVEPVP